MNIATAQFLTGLNKGHIGGDALKFFKQIDAAVSRGLAACWTTCPRNPPRRSRSDRAAGPTRAYGHPLRLCRGTFTSGNNFSQAITTFAEHWNADPKPFIWQATADDIVTKVSHGRECLREINTQMDHSHVYWA